MTFGLYTLTSPLHDEAAVNAASAAFISEIEKAAGISFDVRGSDFSDYGSHDLDLIYVRTGGTEGLFKEVFPDIGGPIRILTSGKSNSLAASMEILSYLNTCGCSGEIIHGSTEYIAGRISVLGKVSSALKKLSGSRLGIIGEPSDWLISSDADSRSVYKKLGLTLVNIPISELIEEFGASVSFTPDAAVSKVMEEFGRNAPEPVRKYADGAFRIYAALKTIVARHDLSGFTLRCFDLLDTLGNTGCLALAMLNAEGIPAGCEGDVPALMSMAIGNALTGTCGFQSNPSRIDPEKGEILFAHCTIPLNMVRRYGFNTHFESGIGVAICGDIPAGGATIFKISGDLSCAFCCEAELLRSQSERDLCRTQAVLRLDGTETGRRELCTDYFLKNPIGNHHIVFPGRCKALFDALCENLQSRICEA